MQMVGMVIGGILCLLGLLVMFTPLRMYFVMGWLLANILILQGIISLVIGLRRGNRDTSKISTGALSILLGVVLLASDFHQVLTQVFIVYLVAGGIMLTGLIELLLGYSLVKRGQKQPITLAKGGITFLVGLLGLIFKNLTISFIGLLVGFVLINLGLIIFGFAKNLGQATVVTSPEEIDIIDIIEDVKD